MADNEKGSVSLKMVYLKGRIKGVPWDKYLPCYVKKSQSQTEMLCSLYISKGDCFDFVLQLLRALMGQGEGKKTTCSSCPHYCFSDSAEESQHTMDLSTCSYHVLHLQSAFPDLLLSQEHPCSPL